MAVGLERFARAAQETIKADRLSIADGGADVGAEHSRPVMALAHTALALARWPQLAPGCLCTACSASVGACCAHSGHARVSQELAAASSHTGRKDGSRGVRLKPAALGRES